MLGLRRCSLSARHASQHASQVTRRAGSPGSRGLVVRPRPSTAQRRDSNRWWQPLGVGVPRVTRPLTVRFARAITRCAASSDAATGTVAKSEARSFPEKDQGQNIRRRFLEFYEKREHTRKPSGSLVPEDPTVLLTIAGMLPFKPVFLGQAVRPAPRVTTTQKCVRTNDIENVGVTKRHHTFFEMLGNFSFGDYFKVEACQWAWELSIKEFGLDPERVWVSVFEEDDETYEIWRDVVGVKESHIQRMGAADNFWASGATGPCGPCSELYYDFQPDQPAEGASLEDDDRFIEFYNLVFMEKNRDADGKLTPLANKNIDTGMGLERMAQILQKAPNNYETDLIFPIIAQAAAMAGVDYAQSPAKVQTNLKVMGDHTRAVVYLISDGVNPSNIGRGYIVRRLLRRVVRCGRLLGIKTTDPFTPQLAQVVIDMSADCDPAVAKNAARILKELALEEERFVTTLERGEAMLEQFLAAAKKAKSGLSGRDAFTLYDTFGFPVEITQEAAAEAGVDVDMDAFAAAMDEQRKQSQAAAGSGLDLTVGNVLAEVADRVAATEFRGYDELAVEGAAVLALMGAQGAVQQAAEGDTVQVVLDRTPFYAESGGQVGDQGILTTAAGATLAVTDCTKAAGGRLFVHTATVTAGSVSVGDMLAASVDAAMRRATACNHTATHLLQSALKQVLGEDTAQAGSYVDGERLRFDFNAPKALSPEQIAQVEALVNQWIGEAHPVQVAEMELAEAKQAGATAMFGEKYADMVRVVDVPMVSMELCGGTHAANTAEIRGFKVLSEAGIASGVRRIEAVAGGGVIELLNSRDALVKTLTAKMKVKPEEVGERLEKMLDDAKAAQKQLEALKAELALAKCAALATAAATAPNGAKLVVERLDGVDAKSLQTAAEELLTSLGDSAAVVLASELDGKVALVTALSPAVVKGGLKAGVIVGAAAKLCGGGGGGKPNLAQAGGKDPSKIPDALALAREQLLAGLAE